MIDDIAAGKLVFPTYGIKQCCLAGTVWTYEKTDFVFTDRGGHMLDCLKIPEGNTGVLNFQNRFCHLSAPPVSDCNLFFFFLLLFQLGTAAFFPGCLHTSSDSLRNILNGDKSLRKKEYHKNEDTTHEELPESRKLF